MPHSEPSGVGCLRAALAAAEQRAADRAAFLAATSHEMREPMSGVLGMARLLRETVLDDEQRGYLEAIIDSAEALLTVINDILDLSQVDAGRLQVATMPFDLPALVGRVARLLEPRARAKGISLVQSMAPNMPAMRLGDPGRIRQILLNLAGNAVKFTETGMVTISLAPLAGTADRVVLEVVDTGPGIPADALERLFTAFGQMDGNTGRLHGGSGLGLMIARRLAERVGGALSAAPGNPGGTCFRLELPLPEVPARRDAPGSSAMSLAGSSLLAVAENARMREPILALAASWGMAVRRATGMADAMLLLLDAADRRTPVDIVLCDADLPDGTGEDLVRRIRAEPALVSTAVALLVASGFRGDAAAAAAAGADAYLVRPIGATTLADCLRALRGSGPHDALITSHSLADRRPASLRILLVDDNAVNLKLASILLERAGHRVTVLDDGARAVQAVAAADFDLVLMDVQMPNMDGLEAARRIRALPDRARARVPIVAVTANALNGAEAECRSAGMNGHVAKPFDRAGLLGAVERWARQPA
jgi:CheY-like chemotaxis protein